MKELITNQFGTFSTELQNFIKQTADQSLSNQIPRLIEHYTDISRKKTLDEKTIDNQTQQIEALKSQMLELENQKHRLESEILDASKDKQVLVDELMSVYSSKSFRLTRPLRAFARWVRKCLGLIKAPSNKSMTVTTNSTAVNLHLLIEPYYQEPSLENNSTELKNSIEELRRSIARNETNDSKDKGRS